MTTRPEAQASLPAASNSGCGRAFLAFALLVCAGALAGAELHVTGLGWLGNRTAEQRLKLLLGEQRGATLDANAIEDAALVLISSLNEQGYLEPLLTVETHLTDGREEKYPLDAKLEHPLPRPLTASAAMLHFERGRRFALREVSFSGLTTLTEKEAKTFFVGDALLIPLASERIYSPSRLQRALSNLEEALRQQGYAEAAVTLTDVQINHDTGVVHAAVKVQEGRLWLVHDLQMKVSDESPGPANVAASRIGQLWTSLWRQDTANAIRRWYYRSGHPDVQVTLSSQAADAPDGTKAVTVLAQITPGPVVHVGQIRFKGNEHTREKTLRRLVKSQPDELLNPIRFDNAQARISQLGVFRSVNLRYDPPDGATRDVEYDLTEGQRQELSVLAGYGSYEQFRGGIEWKKYNLFGLAHSSSLKLVQSVKSSQGDYLYTVPELFGSATDGSVRLFGLNRQEFSFRREEYGANVSLLWPVKPFGFSLTTGYTFKHLRNAENELATKATDQTETNVASVDVGLVRDRRDNPLTPHKGYKLQAQIEAANKGLGGEVVYQQIVLSGSYHTGWGNGRWIHLGISHGVVTTFGASDDSDLPVSVRFYPGGDGSIRGYQRGAAAPRDAAGEFIGAKSYLLGNIELEQALTAKWSVVVFGDALGTTARLGRYPFSEELYSVGLGVRYQTIIGPVRIEYGHNLKPRPQDPSGTLQLSIGFPF
jgi:outer membrane protein insertion porin family